MKKAFNAGGHHSLEQQLALEAELQAQAADTEDFQEGLAAFSTSARQIQRDSEPCFPSPTAGLKQERMSDDITLLWEPHVIPLMRCNIWHVRGRDRDLMVDTGMGIASLTEALRRICSARR